MNLLRCDREHQLQTPAKPVLNLQIGGAQGKVYEGRLPRSLSCEWRATDRDSRLVLSGRPLSGNITRDSEQGRGGGSLLRYCLPLVNRTVPRKPPARPAPGLRKQRSAAVHIGRPVPVVLFLACPFNSVTRIVSHRDSVPIPAAPWPRARARLPSPPHTELRGSQGSPL